MNGKSLSNRILGGSFAASVVVNLAWVAAVSHSGLFGAAAGITQLHEREFKVFKPIPQKRQVKQKERMPLPPPKLKPPIKIKPLKEIKVREVKVREIKAVPVKAAQQLPAFRPRQTTARHPSSPPPQIAMAPNPAPVSTSAASVTHPIRMATTMRSASGPVTLPHDSIGTALTRPSVPSSVSGPETTKIQPSAPAQAPQIASKPPVQPEAAPPKKEAPEQPKLAIHKPGPVEERHPDNWVAIDKREAVGVTEVNISKEGIDSAEVTNDKIVISYTIDEAGRVRNARVKTSSGSSELDSRVLEAVSRKHCVFAIQDGIPRESSQRFTYELQ